MSFRGLTLLLLALTSSCASRAPATLVVLPFTVEGAAPDPGAVTDLAGRTQDQLETALRGTHGVVWLPLDVRQRPPDPRSGKPAGARFAVRCIVLPVPTGIRIRWHVIAVESGRILGTDGMDVPVGGETAAAAAIASRVAEIVQGRR